MASNLFCLEYVKELQFPSRSLILPALENLTMRYGITNVYQVCDDLESLEERLGNLLYEDRNFKDYQLLYFVFEGKNNQIVLDNYYYSLEEIAEFFEGKLKGKIIHFANTMLLDLEEETFQYFLDVTGAKALSGYVNHVPLLSTVLDNLFFSLCQEYDDVVDVVEELFEKQYNLAKSMGFRLYY